MAAASAGSRTKATIKVQPAPETALLRGRIPRIPPPKTMSLRQGHFLWEVDGKPFWAARYFTGAETAAGNEGEPQPRPPPGASPPPAASGYSYGSSHPSWYPAMREVREARSKWATRSRRGRPHAEGDEAPEAPLPPSTELMPGGIEQVGVAFDRFDGQGFWDALYKLHEFDEEFGDPAALEERTWELVEAMAAGRSPPEPKNERVKVVEAEFLRVLQPLVNSDAFKAQRFIQQSFPEPLAAIARERPRDLRHQSPPAQPRRQDSPEMRAGKSGSEYRGAEDVGYPGRGSWVPSRRAVSAKTREHTRASSAQSVVIVPEHLETFQQEWEPPFLHPGQLFGSHQSLPQQYLSQGS